MNLRELGWHLRALRSERALTLSQLADAASVSVSMLSAVERGDKSPTITVLARIARGLGVPLSAVIADQDEHRVVIRRADEQEVIEEAGWRRVVLTPVIPGVNFELVRSTLPPRTEPGAYPAYAPGSHEFVTVESGTLHLTIGDRTMKMSAGDSIYFAADTPHRYANRGSRPCRYYVAALIIRPRRPSHAPTPVDR